MVVYWMLSLGITFYWAAVADGYVNLIFIISLSILNFYITIRWRDNKFVFGFMFISVIIIVIILFLMASSKNKK